MEPSVIKLRVHLENEQQVTFEDGHEHQALETSGATELTAFFDFNRIEKETQEASGEDFDPMSMPTYVEMPETHTYQKNNKSWKPRERKFSLGRINNVSVTAGDVFYLRMLLHNDHCRGKTSFSDMKIVDDEVCESYQDVCRKLGLLDDDAEWHNALLKPHQQKPSIYLKKNGKTLL